MRGRERAVRVAGRWTAAWRTAIARRPGERVGRAARKAVAVLALVAAAVLGASIVRASGNDGRGPSILDKDHLVIGVRPDLPGLGLRKPDGTFAGFDVDVVTYVAGRLGVRSEDIRFRATSSSEREKVLRDGTVDMVVATYSITPERKTQVTFAGPYYVAHQDILVRDQDRSIRGVRDLRGRRLCRVSGTVSWRRVVQERKVAATPVPAGSYGECVADLVGRRVDAVSTDDLILAGFAVANGSGVRMVNAPFTNERYGVGLKKGDLEGCEAVNRILTEMYQNGVAETLLSEWFGSVDFDVTTTVPGFEGCA
jgi:glutamate transport system substrate-binding protein